MDRVVWKKNQQMKGYINGCVSQSVQCMCSLLLSCSPALCSASLVGKDPWCIGNSFFSIIKAYFRWIRNAKLPLKWEERARETRTGLDSQMAFFQSGTSIHLCSLGKVKGTKISFNWILPGKKKGFFPGLVSVVTFKWKFHMEEKRWERKRCIRIGNNVTNSPLLWPSGPRRMVHSSIEPKDWKSCLTSSSLCCLLSIPTKSFRSSEGEEKRKQIENKSAMRESGGAN